MTVAAAIARGAHRAAVVLLHIVHNDGLMQWLIYAPWRQDVVPRVWDERNPADSRTIMFLTNDPAAVERFRISNPKLAAVIPIVFICTDSACTRPEGATEIVTWSGSGTQ
jgi:hypothetical protein